MQSPNDPQSLNRYSYVRNNPLKYVDPTGLWWTVSDDCQDIWIDDDTGDVTPGYIQTIKQAEEDKAGPPDPPLPLANPIYPADPPAIVDTIGTFNAALATAIGLGLALMSFGTLDVDAFGSAGSRGEIIVNNVKEYSPAGLIMSALGGNPVTFGYVILNKNQQMTEDTKKHELGHVTQYAVMGSGFFTLYAIDSVMATIGSFITKPKLSGKLRGYDIWNRKWMERSVPPLRR